MKALDLDHLQSWIDKRQVDEDTLTDFPVAALAAILDHPQPPRCGDPMPPLWHWLYFKPIARSSAIDTDGHPVRGGFLPPIPLASRMWAGGRLKFLSALQIGEHVSRETKIRSITAKRGRRGPLVFLCMVHRISGPQGLAIEEEQNVVYRETASAAISPSPATDRRTPDWREEITPDEVMLFRYSALTFNAHRIHYDRPYAEQVEGYPGLLVQGPLTATLLLDRFMSAVRRAPLEFEFRAASPVIAGEPIALCGKAAADTGSFDLWAETPDRRIAMTACVRFK
ncbi:MAG: MaoC family dehydratase N-terminal domain-containing protein [Pseudomonadota bacterium]|nr:MaoC family dehydratase N-terminal domain-containing protein [Pseudomonadota bacterium]